MVSGVTGFIGSALASRLIAEGCEVFGLVRAGGSRRRIEAIPRLHVVEYDEQAAAFPAEIVRDCQPDVVFHLAAYGVQAGANDVDAMLRGNIHLTVDLLRATAQIPGCRFIHTGSCFEYGRAHTALHITEDFASQPFSPYGAAKLASVQLVRTLAPRLGVPSAILRPFAVFGPGEAPERLLPSLLTALREGRPLDLTPGEQRRDWLHVDDVCAAYLRAAQLDEAALNGEIWNVCSGTPVSVRQFGETLARLLGASPNLLRWGRLAYRPDEPMWIVGSNHRFCKATGWTPKYSLAEGLNRCRIATHEVTTCPTLQVPAAVAA